MVLPLQMMNSGPSLNSKSQSYIIVELRFKPQCSASQFNVLAFKTLTEVVKSKQEGYFLSCKYGLSLWIANSQVHLLKHSGF